VVEVAFLAGEFERLGANIDVDELFAGVAQVVLAHVFGDLPADGRRGALHDDLHAVCDGGLELVGSTGRAALVVVLQQLHRLAVPATGGIELVGHVARGSSKRQSRRGLRAGQRLDQGDLDGRSSGDAARE
jgi:hypothetical protein